MASVCKGPNGRKTIRLSPGERVDRPKIALGKTSKREANTARVHVEQILTSKKTGEPIPPATSQWVAGIPDAQRRRLEHLELIGPTIKREEWSIDQWAEEYIRNRTDLSESGRNVLKYTRQNLAEFFEPGTLLNAVTAYDAQQFQRHLLDKYEEATSHRRMRAAREIFDRAVDAELIKRNVFSKVKLIGSEDNPDRQEYVPRDVVATVIAECPDLRWKLIFGLTRYAGLRCPSEIATLRWGDVDFDKRSLHVYSPKKAKTKKPWRRIPLRPELYTLLEQAYHEAEEGTEKIIADVDADSNLRTTAEKIIARAGVEPWTKTFQNLRLSCCTDWANKYPVHEAEAWGGHNAAIAMKHYWMVSEERFAQATGQLPKERGHDRGQTTPDNDSQPMSAFPEDEPIRNTDRG
jgi:integrase